MSSMDAQMFGRFVSLHSRLQADEAPELSELWRAGVNQRRIRALYPLELELYFPKLLEVFSERQSLTSLLTSGIDAAEKFEGVLYSDDLVDATEDFVYSAQGNDASVRARACLPAEDIAKLLQSDEADEVMLHRQLQTAVISLLNSFADTLGLCYNWEAYAGYLASYEPRFKMSTKPDAPRTQKATLAFSKMLLEII